MIKKNIMRETSLNCTDRRWFSCWVVSDSWDPVDCSPLSSSVHGIFQARILEWVAISFSRGPSWSRDRTQVSCIAGRHFNLWVTREAHKEVWAPKNWCFQTVVLKKTVESPLDCKEIKPVNPKGNPLWIFIERTVTEAEAPLLWPSDAKSWLFK